MNDRPRLIEVAFPLKEASLDSVHEKNVRHGHISTLHIWPARRPLAACRAALIATLLPDPGTPEMRKDILERLGGHIIKRVEKKKMPSGKVVERPKEETIGGILHWGRESLPDLEWFREEIRKAYDGRAPRVLDPFAGGGAIPLEAMRLGCEATAIDINPVAWFILKCTLEYPQKLAAQMRPLPEFVLQDEEFMEEFYKDHPALIGTGKTISKKQYLIVFDALRSGKLTTPEADLAWHVRAWGRWVLNTARKDLARFYDTYAHFEPLNKGGVEWAPRNTTVVPTKHDGTIDLVALNAEFDEEYLKDPRNPRWVPKPTVAYLWARTVACKNCRAQIPLLKTRWLCKKDHKRVLLTMQPKLDKTGVIFGIENDLPRIGGNTAQRREHDKRIGQGTVTGSGAWCPCCGRPDTVAMSMEDIQAENCAGRSGAVPTAVILDGTEGKTYCPPSTDWVERWQLVGDALKAWSAQLPHGLPRDPIDSARPSPNARGLSGLTRHGLDRFDVLFNPRQLLSLAAITVAVRRSRKMLQKLGYPLSWSQAVTAYLALAIDRLSDRNSTICHWDIGRETMSNTFQRYALRINWDYAEVNPFAETTGGYPSAIEWIALGIEHLTNALAPAENATIVLGSAADDVGGPFDVIMADPPYYDAIPYADLSDYFYVWLRRSIGEEYPDAFATPLTRKKRELVQHAGRMEGDNERARTAYEEGMARAFQAGHNQLAPDGCMVVVFANKSPAAWETLASAIIQAGFVVDASWPIQTEMPNRAAGGARLASSVWLVCRKRSEVARPGWDNRVLDDMRLNIATRLRQFWDAGIRGPDFVWAATGPALEAYSRHPVVKKANEPGRIMEVHEFLQHVRHMVVNFVVGQVLTHGGDPNAVSGLDDITTYYLLHRNDFGLHDAPIGACILYAVSCGLSDSALADEYEILLRTGGIEPEDEEEEPQTTWADDETEDEEGTGSKVKLRPWNQRKRRSMGYTEAGRPAPLIDQIHRLMHLWKTGDEQRVDDYIETNGIRGSQLFHRVLQSLVELSAPGNEERSILESISNHLVVRGAVQAVGQAVQPELFESETVAVEFEKE